MKLAAMIFSVMAVVTAAGTASAQAPARRVCDPGNSEKVTLAAVAADPAAFMGKCVRVEAIYSDERLYADADAIYGLNAKSIGGYVDGQGDVTGFWTGTFTGRVADCAKAEDDLLTGLLRSPGISLNYRTLGCLAPEGPFLVFMSQGELKPSKLTRRMPGARGADLAVASENWEHRGEVARLAGDFVAALQSGDRAALKMFVRSDYAIEQLIAGEGTAIDALKTVKQRQLMIFTHGASSADMFSSEACFCLTADCTKRWPIARRDADNQKQRPYACLQIDGVKESGSWRYRLDASRDFDGLPE
ncbi:MAG: hypothetical protein QM773_00675 [Hyphomonadaceae bacterium]